MLSAVYNVCVCDLEQHCGSSAMDLVLFFGHTDVVKLLSDGELAAKIRSLAEASVGSACATAVDSQVCCGGVLWRCPVAVSCGGVLWRCRRRVDYAAYQCGCVLLPPPPPRRLCTDPLQKQRGATTRRASAPRLYPFIEGQCKTREQHISRVGEHTRWARYR